MIDSVVSTMSDTETNPSENVFDSETRQRPSKSGLETKTNTKSYNTVNCSAMRTYFEVKYYKETRNK